MQSGLAQRAGHLLEPITKLLFRLPGAAGSAILMSLIGGYPVGARMTVQLLDAALITQKQAQRMLFFCVNSGPAFLISAVGSAMLRSRQAGLILCAALTASALLIWALHALSRIQRDDERKPCCCPLPARPWRRPWWTPLHKAAQALYLSAFGSFYFPALLRCSAFLPLPSTLRILLQCFLEVTSGCASAAGKVPLPALALVLGWGGICVHCQVLHDVSKTKLSLPLIFLRQGGKRLACLPDQRRAFSGCFPVKRQLFF